MNREEASALANEVAHVQNGRAYTYLQSTTEDLLVTCIRGVGHSRECARAAWLIRMGKPFSSAEYGHPEGSAR